MAAASRRTERCERHGIAIGLCESTLCKGSDVARKRDSPLTRLESPRCQRCRQRRPDAVLRDGNDRHCDDCWEFLTKRRADLAARKWQPPTRDHMAERARRIQRESSEHNDQG